MDKGKLPRIIRRTPTPLLPSQILDLSCWYLTLPVNDAQMIRQPALSTYQHPEYFFVQDGAVVFTAPCGGATTKHSNYPRSELRETERNNARLASWSTEVGTHTLTLRGATLALPPAKPQVVLAQIHDGSEDLLEVVADGRAIRGNIAMTIRWQGAKSSEYLDSDYRLGAVYAVTVTASKGVMTVRYSCGETSNSLSTSLGREGCYFKAGCYTQSNPTKGDDGSAIGQTMLTAVTVSHIP